MRCLTPINIKNPKTGHPQEVPCSKCWACLCRRADAWAFRILQEKKRSKSAHFIGLTYDDAHVPVNPETMRLTLDRKAIPLYMKRLRKLHDKIDYPEKKPLKYYAVGEYGEDYERPHYHMILFNAIPELIPIAWSIDKVMLGRVHIGEQGVTAGGARYLAQYMLTGQDEKYILNADGSKTYFRERPFSLMSKNLGDNYITEQMKKWHLQRTGKKILMPNGTWQATRDRYYAIQDGFKIALPRYYRDKIFPKIYRDIDVPLITEKFTNKELEEAEKDFTNYANNKEGLIQSYKVTKLKKQKAKQRSQRQEL